MFQKIYSKCGDTWVFSCFLTCNIRFLLLKQKKINSNCNQFHNILRLFDVFPNFIFTTSGTMGA